MFKSKIAGVISKSDSIAATSSDISTGIERPSCTQAQNVDSSVKTLSEQLIMCTRLISMLCSNFDRRITKPNTKSDEDIDAKSIEHLTACTNAIKDLYNGIHVDKPSVHSNPDVYQALDKMSDMIASHQNAIDEITRVLGKLTSEAKTVN